MIKTFIDGTHKFTKVSAIIQVILWVNFLLAIVVSYYFPTSPYFGDFYRNNIPLFQFQNLIMLISPFIGVVLSIVSLFLDKQKDFAIAILAINFALIGYIVYMIMIVLSFFGG